MEFNLQPTLTGQLVTLRPMREDDWDALFLAASDPLIWEQHPESDRYLEPVFRRFFEGGMESGGAFVVIDNDTGEIIGSTRFANLRPEADEVEIGWSFVTREYWGRGYNPDMKRLMMDHAYQWVGKAIFVIGENNRRSRIAIERLGGVLTDRDERPGSVIYEISRGEDAPTSMA